MESPRAYRHVPRWRCSGRGDAIDAVSHYPVANPYPRHTDPCLKTELRGSPKGGAKLPWAGVQPQSLLTAGRQVEATSRRECSRWPAGSRSGVLRRRPRLLSWPQATRRPSRFPGRALDLLLPWRSALASEQCAGRLALGAKVPWRGRASTSFVGRQTVQTRGAHHVRDQGVTGSRSSTCGSVSVQRITLQEMQVALTCNTTITLSGVVKAIRSNSTELHSQSRSP